jgi:hypothetical protein
MAATVRRLSGYGVQTKIRSEAYEMLDQPAGNVSSMKL